MTKQPPVMTQSPEKIRTEVLTAYITLPLSITLMSP